MQSKNSKFLTPIAMILCFLTTSLFADQPSKNTPTNEEKRTFDLSQFSNMLEQEKPIGIDVQFMPSGEVKVEPTSGPIELRLKEKIRIVMKEVYRSTKETDPSGQTRLTEIPSVFKISKSWIKIKSFSPSSDFSTKVKPLRLIDNTINAIMDNSHFISIIVSIENIKKPVIFDMLKSLKGRDYQEAQRIVDSSFLKSGSDFTKGFVNIEPYLRLSSGKTLRVLEGHLIRDKISEYIKNRFRQESQLVNISNHTALGDNGKSVGCWDYHQNKFAYRQVIRNFVSYTNSHLIVGVKNQGELITTENHPFYVDSKGWVKASKLEIGDKLVSEKGRSEVEFTRIEQLKKPKKVHNLEVKEFNNYFVLPQDINGKIGKPVLVHNCNEDALSPDEIFATSYPEGIALSGEPIDRDVPESHSASIAEHICFTQDTLIRVKSSTGYKRITDIISLEMERESKGLMKADQVLACNDLLQRCEYKQVQKVFVSYASQLVHIRALGMTEFLSATPNHPFWVEKDNHGKQVHRYIRAIDLAEGSQLAFEDINNHETGTSGDVITSIEHEELAVPVPVFNLSVEGYENYYVAPASDFNDSGSHTRFYKVHNCSAGLDFVPVVGGAKGILEAALGQDLITGEDLAIWERCLAAGAIIPGAGAIVKKIASSAKAVAEVNKDVKLIQVAEKIEAAADRVGKATKVAGKDTEKVLESAKVFTDKLSPGKIKTYISNVDEIPRAILVKDMESIGLKLKGNGSPDGKFMEFVDHTGRMRAKIHPPDGVTTTNHLHLYDSNGNPLNKILQIVKKTSPDAHVPIQ